VRAGEPVGVSSRLRVCRGVPVRAVVPGGVSSQDPDVAALRRVVRPLVGVSVAEVGRVRVLVVVLRAVAVPLAGVMRIEVFHRVVVVAGEMRVVVVRALVLMLLLRAVAVPLAGEMRVVVFRRVVLIRRVVPQCVLLPFACSSFQVLQLACSL